MQGKSEHMMSSLNKIVCIFIVVLSSSRQLSVRRQQRARVSMLVRVAGRVGTGQYSLLKAASFLVEPRRFIGVRGSTSRSSSGAGASAAVGVVAPDIIAAESRTRRKHHYNIHWTSLSRFQTFFIRLRYFMFIKYIY